MKNRLQIKYYKPATFPYTRENAIEFIKAKYPTETSYNGKVSNQLGSLPGEPIAVFYGDDVTNLNVILAIGTGGKGDILHNTPYFLIDTAKLNEDLSLANKNIDGLNSLIEQVQKDLEFVRGQIKELQNEILNVNNKIGTKTDVDNSTVYGYINQIIGDKPIDKLASITEIGEAIVKLRNRSNKIVEAVNTVSGRVTTLEERADELNQNIEDEKTARIEDIKKTNENILVEKDRAESVESVLRTDVEVLKTNLSNEIENRAISEDSIRKDFEQADKDRLVEAKAYSDEVSALAVSEANKYTDAAKKNTESLTKSYIDTSINEAKETLKAEIADTENRVKVKSTDKSVIVGPSTVDGTDLSVHIDERTIIRNENGSLSVASEKLVQYNGANAIEVSEANGEVKTISLKISENDKILTNDSNGLFANLELKWAKSEDDAKDQIQLLGKYVDGKASVISYINVDEFIKAGILSNVELVNENGVTYLKFSWKTNEGEKVTTVDVTELIDVYTAGNGLELNGSEFSVKLAETNENRFLSVTDNGIKLSGVETFVKDIAGNVEKGYKDGDNQIKNDITAVKLDLINETTIRTEEQEKNNKRLSALEKDSHVHTNKEALDTITSDKITVWDSSLNTAKAYTDERINDSFIFTVTDITPEAAASQTLVRQIIVGDTPVFYVSNSTKDIYHDGNSLYNVLSTITENAALKNRVEVLEQTILGLSAELNSIKDRIDGLNLKVDMEEIKSTVVPVAVAESKKAIISSEVFKGIGGEVKVDVDAELGTITCGFDEDAIFMADYNTIDDNEEEMEILS